MKKIIYTFVFSILLLNSAFAQSFKAETSELFQDDVGKPVLLMKDGTTIFQYDDLAADRPDLDRVLQERE